MTAATRHRGRARGFTLIELMISLTAGLLISSAAFLLARNASRFFSKEAAITTAQFANVIAMTRLSSDLKRSAYAATPNIQTEDWLCGNPATWPVGMQKLAGIHIIEDGSVAAHGAAHTLSAVNNVDPDSVVITGAFSTTEIFSVSHIVDGGGTITVVLQNDAPMIRSLLAAQGNSQTLDDIFRPGRMLRIIEKDEGKMMFGIIQAVNAAGAAPNPASPKVELVLSAAVALPQVRLPGECGCIGLCTGAVVNPVSRVLYDLRQIDIGANPGYAPLYSPALHDVSAFHRSLAEATRTDLVRVELDANDQEIPGTLELVAEYGVDLEFGITREVPQNPPVAVPVLQRLPLGHPDVYNTAAAVNGGLGTPENIRAVQVRFSTRASRQDRDADIGFIGDDQGRLRYSLGPVSATNPERGFARMRTLITEVALMNHPRNQP